MENSTIAATSYNTTLPGEEACVPDFGRSDLIAFCILVVIGGVWNTLVLWAIIVSRKKLKRNFVYKFVASVVAANIALAVVMVLTLLTFLLAFERPYSPPGTLNASVYDQSNSAHIAIMTWWAFRKTLVLGLFLVMSGNVVALIAGIVDSAHFVGRTGGTTHKLRFRPGSPSATTGRSFLTPRRRSSIFITLSWVIPFIFTCITFGWSCVEYCDCLPAYYNKLYFCTDERNINKCSHVWAPLTNGHLLLGVVIWAVDAVALFGLLYSAVAKYRSVVKPPATPNDDNISTKGSIKSFPVETDLNRNEEQKQKRKFDFDITRTPLHPTIKLLIALSVTYTICTTPMMTCFAVDAFVEDREGVSDIVVTISSVIVYAYTYICPAFLVAYMPGLRSALIRLLLPCTCATTSTVVVNRVARFATVKRVK